MARDSCSKSSSLSAPSSHSHHLLSMALDSHPLSHSVSRSLASRHPSPPPRVDFDRLVVQDVVRVLRRSANKNRTRRTTAASPSPSPGILMIAHPSRRLDYRQSRDRSDGYRQCVPPDGSPLRTGDPPENGSIRRDLRPSPDGGRNRRWGWNVRRDEVHSLNL